MWTFEQVVGPFIAAAAVLLVVVALLAFVVVQRRRRDTNVHPIHQDSTGGPFYKDIYGLAPGQSIHEEEQHRQAYDDDSAGASARPAG